MGLPDQNFIGAVPASFATQMAMATGMVKNAGGINDGSDHMMSRLVLAKMKTLEEGLQEVVREFKEMRTQGNSPVDTGEEGGSRKRDGGRSREKDKGKKSAGAARKEKEKDRQRPSSAAGEGQEKTQDDVEKTPEDKIIEAFLKKGSSL